MHQTFYIDNDEEISSVIDRLRKSMAIENYFVAPKRAIFLQSIVNLKLLKREAEKMKKNIIIVTQEEVVAAIATRSGIAVQSSIKETEELAKQEELILEVDHVSIATEKASDKLARLNKIGTSDFYPSQVGQNSKSRHVLKKSLPNKADSLSLKPQARPLPKNLDTAAHLHKEQSNFPKLDSEKDRVVEKRFAKQQPVENVKHKQIPSSRIKKIFFVFVVVCFFLLAGVGAYLGIPSAQIAVKANVRTLKLDSDVKLGQQGGEDILLRLLNDKTQLTLQYTATGKGSASGKKAQGWVTIYNEFDKQPQTLVATTRLQTEDGKVFRLIKATTVPGLVELGGQLKPGEVSAEVIADQPGLEYNLESGKLNITGFKGSDKYEKFYAKINSPIKGGTTEGEAIAGISSVDLENAKQKTEAALKEKITTELQAQLRGAEIMLPQAVRITLEKSFTVAKVGDATDSFDYTVLANADALVFDQQEIEKLIKKQPAFELGQEGFLKKISQLEYVSVEPDFEKKTMFLKVHGNIESVPVLDLEDFKKQLLGKNEEELLQLLKKNQNIENVNVIFWPSFINRIPQFPQRVMVELANQ